ncbi:guanine nucleotide exchange factor DBS-like protein [Lates japonicus]|uniref:Guanine nucleotide exchange factor DBS-like protein n=1 Tax=Lates japonicus TaxID=270547 RepID=A0AAD3MZF7_LATJO|nr:guanine nucleotide exchange factor DBS-like protein [Lates japonicus]
MVSQTDLDHNMTHDELENLATVQRLLGQLNDRQRLMTSGASALSWSSVCSCMAQAQHFRECVPTNQCNPETPGFSEGRRETHAPKPFCVLQAQRP